MERLGTVLVFKRGVSPEEAAAALNLIRGVLDLPKETTHYEECAARRRMIPVTEPFKMIDKIHSFDPDMGGPVWYIP